MDKKSGSSRLGSITLGGKDKALFVTGVLGLSFQEWLCRTAAKLAQLKPDDSTSALVLLPTLTDNWPLDYRLRVAAAIAISSSLPLPLKLAKTILGPSEFERAMQKRRIKISGGRVSVGHLDTGLIETLDLWAAACGDNTRSWLIRQLLNLQHKSLEEATTSLIDVNTLPGPYSITEEGDLETALLLAKAAGPLSTPEEALVVKKMVRIMASGHTNVSIQLGVLPD